MRVADKIFEMLKPHTDHVFMLPGGGAMFLVDALGKSGIPYTVTLQEQAAGFMALGYAMASGKLGVCVVTSAPGATNAVTPCAAAWMDSVPVLFISGQARTDTLINGAPLRTKGVQEVNITSVVNRITKATMQPHSTDACLYALERMILLCMSGRQGSCWLDVPLDVQGAEYE